MKNGDKVKFALLGPAQCAYDEQALKKYSGKIHTVTNVLTDREFYVGEYFFTVYDIVNVYTIDKSPEYFLWKK